ncbi:hypothetical protein [Geomonas anaerohicana]|uniref:Uncharacterized protein n=1 Tax=Geomonas anaerohicana TaxID=2798583 RepID=A0ABS0YLS7_9BACT|nr:hypothetical protein [Geomonas anaerohicana]MBJ6752837.1 hypothetical protein [Geomonas anaerohicana]
MQNQYKLPTEIEDLITLVLDTFSKEAMRLRDTSVLTAAKELLESFFIIASQLGTKEHDRALMLLEQQLKAAKKHSATSRSNLKERFVTVLRKPDHKMSTELNNYMKNNKIRRQYADPEIIRMEKLSHDTFAHCIELLNGVESLKGEINCHFFALDLRMHFGIFTRLWLQRIFSFLFKHAFIILISVFIGGIGYSWVVSQGKILASRIFNVNFYGMTVLILVAGLFKEYILSKKIKSIRLKIERQLLFPVLYHVTHANIQGLLHETMSRGVGPRCPGES